ncbi:hypothetical protein [Clostridium polynesiense]|uniref:hypothetical protein n=1 Tax=Clostridium polynesiense TaxID=1325933 RepID=UPI00058B51F7|nr:hypothetical protein [Clostridium polynesiense]
MGILRNLLGKKLKEEVKGGINIKINSEQYEYDNLYYCLCREEELKDEIISPAEGKKEVIP